MTAALDAVKHGYAFVEMNERGRYFSEGDYDILGVPLTDSDDEFDWMTALPWSTGKVGLIGCSSTAEWQLSVASRGNKALATIIPESYGAGVGRVGPYYEQGNWFRGGAVQMLFTTWLYDAGLQTNEAKPNFPPEHIAAGSRRSRKMVGPRRASSHGRLGQGARAPPRKRHPCRRRRAQRHLRRQNSLRPARHDRTHAQRSLLVQGRIVESTRCTSTSPAFG